MKPRTCFVWVWIANDAGKAARYSLRPLPAAELAQSVAAFRLANLSQDPSPVYTVRLAVDGQTSCSCPRHARAGACKHADALTAAGVLPAAVVAEIAVLQQRTKLLDAAEAECRRLADCAMEERTAHQHDAQWSAERIADLTETVGNLAERAARLQTEVAARQAAPPKRSRRVKQAA